MADAIAAITTLMMSLEMPITVLSTRHFTTIDAALITVTPITAIDAFALRHYYLSVVDYQQWSLSKCSGE